MRRYTPRVFGTRWSLVVLLLWAGMFLPSLGRAMSVQPGVMAVLRYDKVSRYGRTPAAFAALRARATPHSVITVTYHGFSAQAQAAFQAAVDIWASLVTSSVPIRIDATWTALGSGILGQAGPTEVFSNFSGAPLPNTGYPKALANALHGVDLDSTTVDIQAEFSSAYPSWYLGTDGNTPANTIDFETVVLHECCHGLGFLGSMNVSGSSGSWGFNGNPFIFDQFAVNGSNQSLLNTTLFPNPSLALEEQLTSNNLLLNGPQAIAANGGVKPKLYAPSAWEAGSSYSHLDENTYPWGVSPNALMTPILSPGISLHYPGPIVMGFFADMGWTVVLPAVATPTFTPDAGTYTTAQNVTIACATPGAAIYYTTNGNDPTPNDTLYQSPVPIAVTTTLKAKAFLSGMTPSAVYTALYTIHPNSTVTPQAGPNGSITPNVPQTIPYGGSLAFTAVANAGYTVASWYLDNVFAQSGGAGYSLTNVTANHAVKVYFQALNFHPGHGDWWMFHHDAQHTGRSPFTGPAAPVTAWTFATGAAINSSPALGADGTVYIGSNDGALYAVNPDGTEKWKFTTGNAITSSPALATDGTIYVGSSDNNLYAVTPDGVQKWSFATGGAIGSSPTLDANGIIYVGSGDGNLYAVTPAGALQWVVATGGGMSSPALGADGTVYVGSTDGNLYAVTAGGTIKWTFLTGSAIYSSPAIDANGIIYVGSRDNNLYAVNPGGTQQWAYLVGNGINSSPAIGADGTIYVGADDDNLYAVTANGTKKWSIAAGSSAILSSPALGADGTIYVGSPDSSLYAVNSAGTKIWVTPTGKAIDYSSPALGADGTLYVGAMDGTLSAITKRPVSVTITPAAGPNGTISPNTPQVAPYGGNVTFTAHPNSGYAVFTWSVDGALFQSGSATCTLVNVTANHAISVAFLPCQPADTNGDWQITIGEVTAYGAAWKSGTNWPIAPANIPIGYVTNAGYLWRAGQVYHFDASFTAPNCWVTGVRSMPTRYTTHLATGTATRTLSAARTCIMPITVTLKITPAAGGYCYAVEDNVPAGWVVSSISDSGKTLSGKVKWGPFFDTQPRTLSYRIAPWNCAHASYSLQGTVSFDGCNQSLPNGTVTKDSL